jgi:hypothetical protein
MAFCGKLRGQGDALVTPRVSRDGLLTRSESEPPFCNS